MVFSKLIANEVIGICLMIPKHLNNLSNLKKITSKVLPEYYSHNLKNVRIQNKICMEMMCILMWIVL